MKKTLIVYNYYNHHQMMEYLIDLVKENGCEVDLLCTTNLKFVQRSSICISRTISIFQRFVFVCVNHLPSVLSSNLNQLCFSQLLFRLLLKKYDYVDFHSVPSLIDPMVSFCINSHKPFDITFWGSDIIHASANRLIKMKFILDKCEFIKCTKNLYDIVESKYGNQYANKYKETYLGNVGLEYLNEISENEINAISYNLIGETNGKVVITCGYNGIEVQNHELMIETLNKLPQILKDKLIVVFPMTYGKIESYYNRIRKLLSESSFRFVIIDYYLSNKELAALRWKSDVMIMAQRTDAFSGSVQEHIFCNNIVLIGEWLDYPLLKKSKAFYVSFAQSNLLLILQDILNNLPEYKKKCEGNDKIIYSLMSWSTRLKDWLPTYQTD